MGRLREAVLADMPDTPFQRGGRHCAVEIYRRRLPPADLATFDGYLADSDAWSGPRIARRMSEYVAATGMEMPPLNGDVITYHRRRDCKCPR